MIMKKTLKSSTIGEFNLIAMHYSKRFGKIEKLQEKHIVSIVEMMPRDNDDLRLLFANERIVLEDGDKKKITDLVRKHGK